MKVLQIANNYLGSKLYSNLFSNLEDFDVENFIFDPLNYKDSHEEVVTDHLLVKKCFSTFDRVLFYTKQNKMLRCIEKYFHLDIFDVVHAHTLFSGGYAAYQLQQKYGIPYVVAVRNTDVNTFFKYMVHLRSTGVKIMKKAVAIVFLSPAYRDAVFVKYVPNSLKQEIMSKTYIIPNGIDNFWHQNKFDVARSLHSPLRLVYAGRLDKNKNIPTVLKAMDALSKKGIATNLTIVGPVQDRSVFDNFVNHPQVMYHDAVPKEKLIDYYRDADIFVMPSFTETFGLVYAEAMSQGLPVLYSKGQGFDGQFAEGEVGYHVDSHNPKDVAEKIKLVCQNYDLLSSNALKMVSKFRWNDIAKQYVEIYRSV